MRTKAAKKSTHAPKEHLGITIRAPRETLISPRRCAEDLDISMAALARLRRAGKISYVELWSGKRKIIRYRVSDVDAMIDRLTVRATK